MWIHVVAIFCVLALVVGQLLFKFSAMSLSQNENIFSLRNSWSFIAAIFLYGVTSVVWVWVLKKAELGRIYPIMAMAFLLVPLGSYFFFGERFTSQYFIGVFLIVLGIAISVSA
jgi:drug/metabolite transporter (DMT)-like permease